MRYLSICSGIEAATVAWHPLGWTPAGFSEIEPFPRAVLEQRHGGVAVDWDHRWQEGQNFAPLFGDFTQIEAHHVGPVDLLVGGTPCQSFSIAGKRLGLDDPRGNLAIEFLALAQRIGARWLVWENVPGVYSSWSGEPDDDAIAEWDETADFAEFLNLFRECGYRGAWRTIDAQYVRVDGFGRAVPQRRRRCFLVGHIGDDARAIPVLFDPESLRGHPAPRRKARKGIDAAPGSDPEGNGEPFTLAERGRSDGPSLEWRQDGVSNTILTPGGGRSGLGVGAVACREPCAGQVSATVSSEWAKGAGGPAGDECQNLVAHALRAEGFDASEDGTGRGTPLVTVEIADTLSVGANQTTGHETEAVAVQMQERDVAPTISARTNGGGGLGTDAELDGELIAVPFDTTQITSPENGSNPQPGDPCHPLAAQGHAPHIAYSIQERAVSENPAAGPQGKGWQEGVGYTLEARHNVQSVAFSIKDDGRDVTTDCAPTLRSMSHAGSHANAGGQIATAIPTAIPTVNGLAVRKLTPRECERLQGFPDDFTAIQWRGKDAPDGPRYKALGNSMAVNVMRWIGTRIDLIERAVAEAAGKAAA